MIKNKTLQKFISATMLGVFVALAANPVIVQAQEHTKAMQEKAVATAQAEAQFEQAKVNFENPTVKMDDGNSGNNFTLDENTVNSLLDANQNTIFDMNKGIEASYQRTMEDDYPEVTRFGATDNIQDQSLVINISANTKFGMDKEIFTDYNIPKGQEDLINNVLDGLNSNFEEGYFSTPIGVTLNLIYGNHFKMIDNVKQDLQSQIDANGAKEIIYQQKTAEIQALKAELKSSDKFSAKELMDSYDKINSLQGEIKDLRFVSTDTLKSIQDVAPNGEGVKLTNSDNYNDYAAFPHMFSAKSCVIYVHGDATGIKTNHNYNPLVYQKVENDATVQLIAEQHTTHEASHCHYEAKGYGIDTGNTALDAKLTSLFMEGNNSYFNHFRAQMHENFADTYTHMIMLKKYGLDNPDLNKLGDLYTMGRTGYSTSHQTSVAWKIINQPEVREQIMNSSPAELSDLANKIASQTVAANFAHNKAFQQDVIEKMGSTPFEGANLEMFRVATIKSTGIMGNQFTDGHFNKTVDKLTEHLNRLSSENKAFSASLKETSLSQSSLLSQSDTAKVADGFFKIANELWANKDFRADFNKHQEDFKSDISSTIEMASNYIPPMLKYQSGTVASTMGKIQDTITLKDLKSSLSEETKVTSLFELTTSVAKYDAALSKAHLKDMLQKFSANGNYDLASNAPKPLVR